METTRGCTCLLKTPQRIKLDKMAVNRHHNHTYSTGTVAHPVRGNLMSVLFWEWVFVDFYIVELNSHTHPYKWMPFEPLQSLSWNPTAIPLFQHWHLIIRKCLQYFTTNYCKLKQKGSFSTILFTGLQMPKSKVTALKISQVSQAYICYVLF